MAHQDQGRKGGERSHADDLYRVIQWLLANVSLKNIGLREDCTWTRRSLVCACLLWAWSDEKTLTERFTTIRKIIRYRFGKQREPAESYQAFTKLMRKWTEPLMRLLKEAFRRRMTTALANAWKVEDWVVFAVDGSRVDVPRTRKNEERYSPKSKLSREAQKRSRRRKSRRRRTAQDARARQANVPRIWLTVLWHIGSGLLWDWRTGASDSSERQHLEAMLGSLPAGTLLTADAGFVGYH